VTLTISLQVCTAHAQSTQPTNNLPNTAYISTADNQWALWTPMDSKATIEAAFETLAKDYHVNRIWWRGGQDEMWLRHHRFREGNTFYFRMWQWLRHLNDEVGTNRIAINAARNNGMSIWMVTGLFEFATQGDAGACFDWPYQSEDELRINHPEFVPVNRWGTRKQAGPVEYAYPEARAIVAKRITDYLVERGYDGVTFYTYVENFQMRYMDEFGFNEPVVTEFKKRHGIDIRTETFDPKALAELRGEYVTQFLRELHASLAAAGKKLCVRISPDAADSHMPELWRAAGKVKLSTAGNIRMDWERWVQEGLVDELNVDWPGNDELLAKVLEATKGTTVAASMLRTFDDGLPQGVTRVVFPGGEVESGYPREAKVGWPDEKIAETSADVLSGRDVFAKRRFLYNVAAQKTKADVPNILPALKDEDVYVRRAALRALAVLKDPAGVAAMEEALADPDNAVRCQAAVALGDLHGPESAARILDAVKAGSTFQFDMEAATQALMKICEADVRPLLEHLHADDLKVRLVAVRALNYIGLRLPSSPSFALGWGQSGTPTTLPGQSVGDSILDAMLKFVAGPEDIYIREMALGVLPAYSGDPRVFDTVLKALEDSEEFFQVRAATALAQLAQRPDAAAGAPEKAVRALEILFKRYGTGSHRKDLDWGWRSVGTAMMACGKPGESALQNLLEQNDDPQLAELAWRILYQKQEPMNFVLADLQQDIEAHKLHPKFRARK